MRGKSSAVSEGGEVEILEETGADQDTGTSWVFTTKKPIKELLYFAYLLSTGEDASLYLYTSNNPEHGTYVYAYNSNVNTSEVSPPTVSKNQISAPVKGTSAWDVYYCYIPE